MYDKEVNNHKFTLSAYNNKGKENNLSTYEKKEKVQDDYVCIYESGKKSAPQPSNARA